MVPTLSKVARASIKRSRRVGSRCLSPRSPILKSFGRHGLSDLNHILVSSLELLRGGIGHGAARSSSRQRAGAYDRKESGVRHVKRAGERGYGSLLGFVDEFLLHSIQSKEHVFRHRK